MLQDVYSGRLKLYGKEDRGTISAAHNYANLLVYLERSEEAKALLRKMIPVARRVVGASQEITLKMRWTYAQSLYFDGATLDDLREAVTTLEEIEPIARRVFGAAHPLVEGFEGDLQETRAALRAREATPPARGA